MINAYNIGDILQNKGKIYSIVCPMYVFLEYYRRKTQLSATEYSEEMREVYLDHPWTLKYPDWLYKPVYYVVHKNPRSVLTFDEFKERSDHIKEECVYEAYEKIPKSAYISVPEDEIKLDIDNICDKLFGEDE